MFLQVFFPPEQKRPKHKYCWTCLKAINTGIVLSAHDISDGGLAVNIAESVISSDKSLGANINIESQLSNQELLFGECGSIIIVTINPNNLADLVLIAKKYNVSTSSIGYVSDDSTLSINNLINISKNDITEVYNNTLGKIMTSD